MRGGLQELVEKYGGPDALAQLEEFVSLGDLEISLGASRAFITECQSKEASSTVQN